jgi:hypothetical protein
MIHLRTLSISSLLVAMLLSSECVLAQEAQTAPEPIKIDAPGVLDKDGATYLLTRDVTAPRTAFMIKGDDITLDLGGHTVTYGTEVGIDFCVGVFIRPAGQENAFAGVPAEGFGGGDRFTLTNGRIVQGAQPVAPEGAITYRGGRMVKEEGDHPRPGRFCHGVYIRGCDGFKLENLTVDVNSRDSNNVQIIYSGAGEIANNHFISSVKEITDRHYPGTSVIFAAVGGAMKIHHNVIDGGGQWGINVSGRGQTGPLVEVHHNVIRHRSYTTNGYAIGCHAPNLRVYANVVASIGRGVHLTGNATDFYNNIVMPKERPNPEYPSTRTHGIKLEHPSRVQVHHNFCRVVAEEGFGDADPLDLDCRSYSQNRVFKNTFEAIRKTDTMWASSINVVNAEPDNGAIIHDNVFRTNQYHFQGTWGGMRELLLINNRFEVIGEPEGYQFFRFGQSRAAQTRGVVFRDSKAVGQTDLKKVDMLYGPSYTRANIDVAVQNSVKILAADPTGNPVSGVAVFATDPQGQAAGEALTGSDGKAEVVLTDFRVIGNEGESPILQRGPYKLKFVRNGREVKTEQVDPAETTELVVEIVDPGRKLYVNAGADRRMATGDAVKLDGVVKVIAGEGEPEVSWKIIKEVGDPKLADASSPRSTLTFENPKESWVQTATLELTATLGEETVRDRVVIRQDSAIVPKAVAAAPEKAKVRTIVQLDGARSTDPRRFPSMAYKWKQTAGPATPLSSDELADPIFYPVEAGSYSFELTVSSPLATSEPQSVTIEVSE